MAQCKITGKEGETFTAGRLGDYTVGANGEVVLGPAQIVTPEERRRVQVLSRDVGPDDLAADRRRDIEAGDRRGSTRCEPRRIAVASGISQPAAKGAEP